MLTEGITEMKIFRWMHSRALTVVTMALVVSAIWFALFAMAKSAAGGGDQRPPSEGGVFASLSMAASASASTVVAGSAPLKWMDGTEVSVSNFKQYAPAYTAVGMPPEGGTAISFDLTVYNHGTGDLSVVLIGVQVRYGPTSLIATRVYDNENGIVNSVGNYVQPGQSVTGKYAFGMRPGIAIMPLYIDVQPTNQHIQKAFRAEV